jgi:AcrR family transcriptional regulator
MTSKKRSYRMTRRAELEQRTRQRITESTVALHGSIGPARTSISAIAAHAGVRRATVYRHFPDEEALFGACSAHWRAANPAPDPADWAAIEDPAQRLRRALEDLYAHYRSTESMRANVLRDEAELPIITRLLRGYRAYLEAVRTTLLAGRNHRGRRVSAAIGHAVAFTTWQSLAREQGLDDRQAAELMCRLVDSAG